MIVECNLNRNGGMYGGFGKLQESNLLVLELGLKLDTRVRDVSTFLNGVLLGNTSSVLEEDDTLVVLDELISEQLISRRK